MGDIYSMKSERINVSVSNSLKNYNILMQFNKILIQKAFRLFHQKQMTAKVQIHRDNSTWLLLLEYFESLRWEQS